MDPADREAASVTSSTNRPASFEPMRVEMYESLVLSEYPIAPDPLAACPILAAEYGRRGPTEADRALLRRLQFAGLEVTFEELVTAAAEGKTRLSDVDLPGIVRGGQTDACAQRPGHHRRAERARRCVWNIATAVS